MLDSNIKYLGFGSPLMDIIADVDHELIKKYKNANLDITLNSTKQYRKK